MAGPFEDEFVNGIREAYCTALSNAPGFFELYRGATVIPSEFGIGAAQLGHRLLCNREPPTAPPPSFTGGQCAGVAYNVTSTWQTEDQQGNLIPGTIDEWNPSGLLGPITFIGQRPVPTNPGSVERAIISNNGANTITFGSIDTEGPSRGWRILSLSVTRQDGQPDTCGDPEPVVPPPPNNYNVVNNDITYTDNSSNDITIPIGIIFGYAYVDADLHISVPFNVEIPINGEVNIDGTIDLSDGDVDFNFGSRDELPPGNGECRPRGNPDEETPEPPAGTPIDPPPPEENEVPRVIRGVIVTSQFEAADATTVFQEDNPDIYAPRLGNIQFLLEFGDQRAWTEDISVRNVRHFIRCPWEGGAIDVRGTPSFGVTWTLSPVYERSSLPTIIEPFQNQ